MLAAMMLLRNDVLLLVADIIGFLNMREFFRFFGQPICIQFLYILTLSLDL